MIVIGFPSHKNHWTINGNMRYKAPPTDTERNFLTEEKTEKIPS